MSSAAAADALLAMALVLALYATILWRASAILFRRRRALRAQCSKQHAVKKSVIDNWEMHRRGQVLPGNHVISRHAQATCHALDAFDRDTPLAVRGIVLHKTEMRICYGCSRPFRRSHPVYLYSCARCGSLFQKYRHYTRNLQGRVALVTGGRTKLGHQVVLKLLRANCHVILTTRRPAVARDIFSDYADYDQWQERLHVYGKPVDLDTSHLLNVLVPLCDFIERTFGRLDAVINCAAQTIRSRDKAVAVEPDAEQNRYGDAANAVHTEGAAAAAVAPPICAASTHVNSWAQRMIETPLSELQEVMRVNAVAPFALTMLCVPLLQRSAMVPFVINVHAREGLFGVRKGACHVHTNMAKAAFHMFTKGLASQRLETLTGQRFAIHGCDPGWVSVDEYYDNEQPWCTPPIDEVDGAARILYPLFRDLTSSCGKTRRHFDQLCH